MDLKEFFKVHNKVALGFSGGVDSCYLLYAGIKYGADIQPIFIRSQFQPTFELDDAIGMARDLGVSMEVIELDVLEDKKVSCNDSQRCYHCKNHIFLTLMARAKTLGYEEIIDGTNASDDEGDRPGMRALEEMRVLSPLRMAGLTKDEIRRLSKEAGLFTWDKPAYACLATRIPTGMEIEEETLKRVEESEALLMEMGYSDFRVRVLSGAARLQISKKQKEKITKEMDQVREVLKPFFETVLLDLTWR